VDAHRIAELRAAGRRLEEKSREKMEIGVEPSTGSPERVPKFGEMVFLNLGT